MLLFLTSLRHPDRAYDYGRVEALLKNTLTSILRQTSEDFRIVVAANVKPDWPMPEKVDLLLVDLPAPPIVDGEVTRDAVKIDKGKKLTAAACYAKRYDPSHVMIVDADDYVSRDIAKFVNDSERRGGWYVDSGYVYSSQDDLVRFMGKHFHRRCGTSMIYNMGDLDLPDYQPGLVEDMYNHIPSGIVKNIFGSHLYALDYFQKKSAPLAPLPFAAAMYVLQTGENHSGFELDRSNPLISRSLAPMSEEICEQFGAHRRKQ